MAIKHKNIEVSGKKPLFGGQSEMDKEIDKWTSKGWKLTNTTASSGKNRYLLSFEYSHTENNGKTQLPSMKGCLVLLVGAGIFAVIFNPSKPSSSTVTVTPKSMSVAQGNSATQTLAATKSPKSSGQISLTSTQLPSATVVKVIPTSTAIPTRRLPSATPQPTAVLGIAKSGTINARSCASTDCAIVDTITAGETVSVLGQEDNWYLVELKDENIGYVRTDLLSVDATTEVAILPTNRASNTLSPTAFKYLGNEAQDVELIQDYLNILTDDREIGSVEVVDGRANGGERGAIIAYMTIESSDAGFIEEIFDIYEAVYEAIDHYDMDIDAVTLVAGDKSGNAAGMVSVSAHDLLAYFDGRISKQEFIEKLTATSF